MFRDIYSGNFDKNSKGRKKGKRGEEREIGVRKKETILFWFPYLIQVLLTAKRKSEKTGNSFNKFKEVGVKFFRMAIIYTPVK